MITDAIDQMREITQSQPPCLQWVVVMVAGSCPFIESYYGSVLGIAAGVHPVLAVPAAVAGNIVSTLACIALASRLPWGQPEHSLKHRGREDAGGKVNRRERLRRRFDTYGVVGVSLTSQAILPSQITAVVLIGFRASFRRVAFWQCLSTALWGCAYGSIAAFGISLLD